MNNVMHEWCGRQIADALVELKKCPSAATVLNPAEAATRGQDGPVVTKTVTYPDGAEAGGCWKEDPVKRERDLEGDILFAHSRLSRTTGAVALLRLRRRLLVELDGRNRIGDADELYNCKALVKARDIWRWMVQYQSL